MLILGYCIFLATTATSTWRISVSSDWAFEEYTSPEEIVLNRMLHDGISVKQLDGIYRDMEFFFPQIGRDQVNTIRLNYLNDTSVIWDFHDLLMQEIWEGTTEEIDSLVKIFQARNEDYHGDELAAFILRESIRRWSKYCIIPLKRGSVKNCYETEVDFGNGLEDAWKLTAHVIDDYLRDELVLAHIQRHKNLK